MSTIYDSFKNIWTKNDLEELSMFNNSLTSDLSTLTLITGISIAIMGPVTTVANGIVIAAILKDPFKQLRSSPSNIIIASMAFCDFLVGAVCTFSMAFLFLSMFVTANKVTKFLAPIALGLGIFLIGVSMFHVLALTIDRVIAVADPLGYKSRVTKSKVFASLSIIWGLFIFLTVLRIVLQKHFYIYTIIVNSILQLAVILVAILSLFIIFYVRKQTKNLKNNSALSTSTKAVMIRDKKTTQSILIILTVFEACLIPYFVTETVLLTCFSCNSRLNIILIFYCTSIVLTHVNSCLNPFLYAFRLPKFRKPVALIARKLFCCKHFSKVENGHTLEILHMTSQGKHRAKRVEKNDTIL